MRGCGGGGRRQVGTATYMAPELVPVELGGTYTGKAYDAQKVDCWACGVFLYAILFGKYPFGNDDSSNEELARSIAHAALTIPSRAKVSPECEDLLRRIFCVDPAKRISVRDIMSHPWYVKGTPPDHPGPKPSELQSVDELTALLEQAQVGRA